MDISSLKSVHTPRELETLGPLDEIKSTLEHEISPLQVHAVSYDELYKVVAKLQYHWDSLQKDAYFKNENSRYIFALLYMEPKARNSVIGLNSSLYDDKERAQKWYRQIAGKVHPDLNPENQEDAGKAFEALRNIYQRMQWVFEEPEKKEA